MNLIKDGLLALFLVGVVGCGDYWKEEETEIDELELGPKRELIIEDEAFRVKNKLFLGHFEENEIIEVHLAGTKFTRSFSGVYERVYQSKWKKRYCEPRRGPVCPMCHFTKIRYCYDRELKGRCHHRYRKQNPDISSPLIFSEPLHEVSAKIMISDNTYSLGELKENQGMKIITRFKLSKEMLLDDDEVFLSVQAEPVKGKTRIGFLGFAHCDGRGKKDFRSGGSTSSRSVPNQERIDYKVSVVIEYPIKEQN